MYCYKINNSYTIYVNTIYLNDCIKASKRIAKKKETTAAIPVSKKKTNIFTHLAPDTLLKHKLYGIGKVISTSTDGIMSVAFASKVAHFQYPESVHRGYLARVY